VLTHLLPHKGNRKQLGKEEKGESREKQGRREGENRELAMRRMRRTQSKC